MLKLLFVWLDAHPVVYWAIGAIATVGWSTWLHAALRREREGRPARRESCWFAFLTLTLLLAWRWPVLFQATPMNPDEAQCLAAALTYAHDPVPFRSVDLTTSGPLNGLILLPTHWLGVPQDYFNARLVSVLLEWGLLLGFFAALRARAQSATAALALLPGVVFFATASDTDFIHYTTEQVAVCLLALALACLSRHRPEDAPASAAPSWGWILGGILLGLMPWAKLQSVPLGIAVGAWGFARAGSDTRRLLPNRLHWTCALMAGAAVPTAVILSLLAATGQLEQFRLSYLAANVSYMSDGLPWSEVLVKLAGVMHFTWQVPAFLGTAALLLAVDLFDRRMQWRSFDPLYWAAAAASAAGLYAICAPRHAFFHYLWLLAAPLCLWAALAALGLLDTPGSRRSVGIWILGLLGLCMPLALLVRRGQPDIYGHLADAWRSPYDDVARHIRALRGASDRLTVWGWWPHLHVETGLPQGTREAHSEHQISEMARRDTFFRQRYLADLRANRPLFFVDAVGPDSFGYINRLGNGHETFPELRDFIAAQYVLVKDFGNARLYLLRDQVEERHARLPLVVPLSVESFTSAEAVGGASRLGDAPPPPPFARRHAATKARVSSA